jgi:ribosome-binding protein aMBF1 (putative translation factor)
MKRPFNGPRVAQPLETLTRRHRCREAVFVKNRRGSGFCPALAHCAQSLRTAIKITHHAKHRMLTKHDLRIVRRMASLGTHIARNVAAERTRRAWDQTALAAKIGAKGWSRSTVSNLELGKRKVTADDLPLLCAAFEISLAQLMFGAEPVDLTKLRL